MPNDQALREHLIRLLDGGQAHATFDSAVRGFPLSKIGVQPKGLPYSGWQLLEHMRIAQHDIVRFSLSPDHLSPAWPEGYWPSAPEPTAVLLPPVIFFSSAPSPTAVLRYGIGGSRTRTRRRPGRRRSLPELRCDGAREHHRPAPSGR